MLKIDVKMRSSDGPEFDCYVVMPEATQKVPAIVLASAIYGVDSDLRAIAEEFGCRGYIAAAPDLFWRTQPGPLLRGDWRAAPRGQPRLEKLKTGERDLVDVLTVLRKQPLFNGRAAIMGFCYSGPYAILGSKRLGYDAGISCHGSQMLDFIKDLDGVPGMVCIIWGDQDDLAPVNVLNAYRAMAARIKNVEVHVLPGVQHGYMMRTNTKAFNKTMYDFSMERALAVLECLRKMPSTG
jgi:carboxymethylenebutenolidase